MEENKTGKQAKVHKKIDRGTRGSVKEVEKIWFSIEDVMAYLSVGRHSVENMINEGAVRAFKPAKQYLMNKREIDNWVMHHCVNETSARLQGVAV